ncbi:uncharacterized protein G2W53_014250 [Senna tora]|uniref:Uncharacterized protein n=1 Tax=Senna tora TaxID=362788 RepID=A0A835C7N9_9FABA|nr:uncharacterized protein G2W53_014250 [Senna tora]
MRTGQLLGLGFLQCLLWAATGGSAAAGPVGPYRRDCRRRCLPSVPLPVVSDVGGSPESLYAFLSSVSRVGYLRTSRFAAGDSQTWTTAASDRGSRWYAGVLTAGSLLLSGFAFLVTLHSEAVSARLLLVAVSFWFFLVFSAGKGVYGGVSVFALDFGIEKAFGEYGGNDGGTRRVQWVLRRHEEDKDSKKSIAARPLTVARQVKNDGRLVCWVPRVQNQGRQDPSTQRTGVQRALGRREVGVQTEETEMVTLDDPSTSGVVKHMEPHTDSSSSEADEGEFFDEASIVSFFDNEEGLLIEQLEKEYEEQERDQKMRLDDGLEGVASLLGMDVHEC